MSPVSGGLFRCQSWCQLCSKFQNTTTAAGLVWKEIFFLMESHYHAKSESLCICSDSCRAGIGHEKVLFFTLTLDGDGEH